MNQMFGEWYRAASLDPQNLNLEARWAGMEKHKGAKELSFAADDIQILQHAGNRNK